MAAEQPFAIRGTKFNMVVLQLRDGKAATVVPALERLIHQSPAFLRDSPVVLGLDDLQANGEAPEFAQIADGLRGLRLVPVGTTGGTGALRQAAAAAGLAQLSKGQQLFQPKEPDIALAPAPTAPTPTAPTPAAAVAEPPPPPSAASPADSPGPTGESPAKEAEPAMVVAQPVRAGNRIYAQGRDLICLATVNAGAEIIADGHIHVYGALRGRAIAGASGFDDARIFALNFDAELVAINGLYQVRENIDPNHKGQQLQVSLHGEELRFAPFG